MRFVPHRIRVLALLLAVAAAACLTIVATHATGAYFSDTKSGMFSGTLGAWGPYLTLTPGCSKAANPNSCGCPKGVLIASVDAQGNLSLDFGGVYQGSCMAWPDVFRITSSATGPLNVSFTVSGAIAPLIASVSFANDTTGGELDAGQTRSVAVKLNVSAQAIKGTYSGTLVVSVVGSSESYSIPMVISVLSRKGKTPPVVPVTSCDYDGCWHHGPVTLHFSANDCGGYGLAYTEYSLDGGVTWTQGTSVTISSPGTTTVLYHSVDIVGNAEVPKSVTVKIDLTAPTTTASASPSGWSKGPVTLTLAATDSGGSGLKATYYKIDGQSQQTYCKPVSLTTGSTVTYWSVDNAGNTETTHTYTPQIDTTAPTTTATAVPSTWTNGTVMLTLAATDGSGCGVKATYYKIGSQSQQTYTAPITLLSATAVTYWSVDNLGNTETTHSFTPQIDTTAPTTTVSGTDANWHKATVTVTLKATDAGGSGVKATYYTINGGAQQTYTAPFSVSTQGSNSITYWSVDNAGNTESTKSCTVKIDLAAPVVTITTPANGASYKLNASVIASWTATDALSGINATLTTGTVASGKAINTSSTGSKTFTVTATDNAGNVTTKTVTYTVVKK